MRKNKKQNIIEKAPIPAKGMYSTKQETFVLPNTSKMIFTSKKYTYMIQSETLFPTNDKAALLDYTGNESDLTIPAYIGKRKLPVVEIGYNAFKGNHILVHVVIPETVRKVSGFCNCSKLRRVIILGENVEIDPLAFYNCGALETVEFPIGTDLDNLSGCWKSKARLASNKKNKGESIMTPEQRRRRYLERKFGGNPLPPLPEDERIYFNVPYAQKDIAKRWHCGFDPEKKLWFTGCFNTNLVLLTMWFGVNEATSEKARKLMEAELAKNKKAPEDYEEESQMRVEIGGYLRICKPTEIIAQWCEDNLVFRNPEYDKKLRMGFWTGDTPSELELYEERDNGDLIVPYGCLEQILSMAGHCQRRELFRSEEKVDYNGTIPLYDYQQKAVDAMLEHGGGILQSAAGSGKTQMGLAIASRLGLKTLWLTHTKDLLSQSKARAETYFPKEIMGTITEGEVHIGSVMTFATVQTMCKLSLRKYAHEWDCVIVDECHRAAGSFNSATRFFSVLNGLCAKYKFGLSATVHRADGLVGTTYALLGKVAYTVPDEAVESKVMKVGIRPIDTGTQMSEECLNPDGTINFPRLVTYLANDESRNKLIDAQIIENEGHPSLILSDRLGHLDKLIKGLPESMRNDAVKISGKMTTKKGKAEREQALEDMRSGRKKYLFATYSLAKEGLDIPCLERLYMCTPQSDYAVIVQSIGRIARTCEGKAEPIAYDFVDDMKYTVWKYEQRWRHYDKVGAYLSMPPTA